MIRPKLPPLERPEDFPGQTRVAWRREPHRIVLAAILGALWPPLIVTLPLWPPNNWAPGLEIDWRLVVLFIGLDTCLAIMQVLYEGLADSKYRPCPLLVKYVEAGWLGRKTERGFYDYRGEEPVPTR